MSAPDTQPAPPGAGPWWLSLGDAAHAIGVSRNTLRTMIRLGQLPTIRIGRRTVVRVVDLERIKATES